MNIFVKLLLVAAFTPLAGCAAANHSPATALADSAVDVVSACEQAVYYPKDREDEQASLGCADVLDVWR